MKVSIFIIFFIFMIYACSPAGSQTKTDYRIEEHQLVVRVIPHQNLVKIADKLNYQSRTPHSEASFLINKNARINRVNVRAQEVEYRFNENFDLGEFIHNPDSADIKAYQNAAELKMIFAQPITKGEILIDYQLTASDSVNKAAFSREYIAYQVKGYIGEKGVFISPSFHWYPEIPGNLSRFRITSHSPDSLYIVSQGKQVKHKTLPDERTVEWVVDYPVDGVHLVGSNYAIESQDFAGVNISTYFFPNSQQLAGSYLSASQRYIAMYSEMIAPYPFSKFAVVENFFPTGYGMPSYTLLGSQVIRLPFIIYTSLGHEIAHNWWGNSVYVDFESGNWCEGLTTYYADYHYKEMEGAQAAMRYRRDLNRDYTVYVKAEKDFPLSEFTERTESATRAIGYGKSTMVFHQLRSIVGDSLFYQAFRKFYQDNKFRKASWSDIQKAAETVSSQDLTWFFRQWVQRSGAPEIRLIDAQYNSGTVELTVEQTRPTFRLFLPVNMIANNASSVRYVWFHKKVQTIRLPVPEKPEKIALDPDFDLFRKLNLQEVPPTLSEIFARDQAILILPDRTGDEKLKAYRKFAEMLASAVDQELTIKRVPELSPEEIEKESIYLLGTKSENSLWQHVEPVHQKEVDIEEDHFLVNGDSLPRAADLLVLAFRVKGNPDRNIISISLGEKGAIGRVGTLLSHYGKYSYLCFTDGRNVLKGFFSTENSPLVYEFQ